MDCLVGVGRVGGQIGAALGLGLFFVVAQGFDSEEGFMHRNSSSA
jgi:hypothetical protein